ncbi:MAG: hypothetical protein GXP62_08680 [Oligoflexia bacterium]|nr:hypothetical protein [Oligoflexia bacterium]
MTSAVSMQDARAISRLKAGDGAALTDLWTRWKTPIWSLCRGMASDVEHARELLRDIYVHLPPAARGWSLDAPVCCQVSALVWSRLQRRLELRAPDGIDVHIPDHAAAPSRTVIAGKLAAIDPELRVIYLLDVFFRCPAATLARISGWGEADIRTARAAAAWQLVTVGTP